MKKKHYLLLLLAFLLIVIGGSFFGLKQTSHTQTTVLKTSSNHVTTQVGTITYKGENGKDALSLLKQHAQVVQASNGLVVSINGRQTDDTKNEFWEFLVNGKEAQVGPTQYKTKSTDTIEWKIATY